MNEFDSKTFFLVDLQLRINVFTIGLKMQGIGQSAEVDFGARLFRYGSAMMGRKLWSWILLKSLKSSLVPRSLLLLFAFVCFVSVRLSAALLEDSFFEKINSNITAGS